MWYPPLVYNWSTHSKCKEEKKYNIYYIKPQASHYFSHLFPLPLCPAPWNGGRQELLHITYSNNSMRNVFLVLFYNQGFLKETSLKSNEPTKTSSCQYIGTPYDKAMRRHYVSSIKDFSLDLFVI